MLRKQVLWEFLAIETHFLSMLIGHIEHRIAGQKKDKFQNLELVAEWQQGKE
jgi:hypothetical protein